jgi:hypothetical protein
VPVHAHLSRPSLRVFGIICLAVERPGRASRPACAVALTLRTTSPVVLLFDLDGLPYARPARARRLRWRSCDVVDRLRAVALPLSIVPRISVSGIVITMVVNTRSILSNRRVLLP